MGYPTLKDPGVMRKKPKKSKQSLKWIQPISRQNLSTIGEELSECLKGMDMLRYIHKL